MSLVRTAALIAAICIFLPLTAYAQRQPVFQDGIIPPNHLVKQGTDGLIKDVGEPAIGDAVGQGVSPFGVNDKLNPLGIATYSADPTVDGSYIALGHDAAGVPTISVGAVGGASAPGCNFDINGSVIPCGGVAGGGMAANANNATMPTARNNLNAAPVLNARDPAYGMKCDNATDDAAALQAALTAAATKGSNVFISGNPSGATATCLIGTGANPPSGVSLTAAPGTIILKPTAGNVGGTLLLGIVNVSNIYIYGLTFDGGGKDFAVASQLTTIYGGGGPTDNVVFDNVRFQHTRGLASVISTNVTNSGFRNSYFTDIGNHWKTTLLTADRVQALGFCCGTTALNHGNFAIGNYFTDVGLDSISATNQHDFLVEGNSYQSGPMQLTAIWNNPQPTAFPALVYGQFNDSMVIIGNQCDGVPGNCIDTDAVSDRVIVGNRSYNAGDSAVGVFGSGNATITGNIGKNGAQWSGASAAGQAAGIALNGALGHVTISGNVMTDDQASISTTCTGTVAVGATSCTAASVTGMMVNDQIKIAGAGVASADLSTAISGISGSVITWIKPTSTSTSGAAVTGIATQLYGVFGKAGVTYTDLKIDDSNALVGNVTGQFGGTISPKGYTVATLPTGIVGGRAYVTDQLTACAAIGAALTGGGAVKCPAFYNGAAWVSG